MTAPASARRSLWTSRSAALSLAGLALVALLCAGCQTTARRTRPANSDDVDRRVTLPRTLANVWIRDGEQPDAGIPYADAGTLLVGSDAILFNGEHRSMSIPARAIRDISWRTMGGDLQTEWAVIIWLEDGVEKLIGFTAADRYRFDTSNRDLYSALIVAWETATKR
jgi:hypothetical protein